MRVFMATLYTETNTFSAIPTGTQSFMGALYAHRDASRVRDTEVGVVHALWRRLAEAEGWDVAEGPAAMALPAGRTTTPVYAALKRDLIAALAEAGPVDMVLLYLHGSMVAEDCDDCEGDILADVRSLVGSDVIIGAELDLHCNVSEAMLRNADALIAYKEYPHVDEIARAEELYALCRNAALGRTRPVTAVFDCKMIGLWRTTEPTVRAFVDRMQALEGSAGILSISLGHGFAWSDVADVGARLWVIADGDMGRATELAQELGRTFYEMRNETRSRPISMDEALDAIGGLAGPVVIADVADNPGMGAAGDGSHFLEACLKRGLRDVAIGCLWDPHAVALCQEAGVGARFDLRVGGKSGPASGRPVDLRASVRGLLAEHWQAGLSGETRAPFGAAAWIEAEGIDIVLVSIRNQTFSPDAFTGLGVDLDHHKVIVVKSTQHFHAMFAPLAGTVLYASSSAIELAFESIPYTKRDNLFWPRHPDPLGRREVK